MCGGDKGDFPKISKFPKFSKLQKLNFPKDTLSTPIIVDGRAIHEGLMSWFDSLPDDKAQFIRKVFESLVMHIVFRWSIR